MVWSDERVELLKKLHTEGLSGGRIAAILGVTRNAIIGKIHRLGLTPRLPSTQEARLARRRSRAKPTARSDGQPRSPKFSRDDISKFIDAQPDDRALVGATLQTRREDQCCFPIGDPLLPGFGYCKRDKELGSYCMEHFHRLYPSADVKSRKVMADEKEVEAV